MNAAPEPTPGAETHSQNTSVLLVGSLQPHAGKTALASALAVTLAYGGRRMLAVRLAGEGDAGAGQDAGFYRTLPFARGRGGSPVSAADAVGIAREQMQAGGSLVVEAPTGADLAALAPELGAAVVIAVRSADAAAMKALGELSQSLGERLVGVVAMAVPRGLAQQAHDALTAGSARVLGVIPEDATLYAPSVLEIAEALEAEIVLGEPEDSDIIEHLMIGPITTDPGQPYYSRPRSKRAVITRSDKTDLQLAAMHSDIDCLVLTGGVEPSPYTIDRAADDEITVLLTKADTGGAVKRLEDIFLTTRFAGEEKLEQMRVLLDQHLDWVPIRQALSISG
jgi:BioD-like phosphotransacetylase family protein